MAPAGPSPSKPGFLGTSLSLFQIMSDSNFHGAKALQLIAFQLIFLLVTGNNTVLRSQELSGQAAGPARIDAFDGWIRLFDGKTLYGWKPAHKADWSVGSQGELGVSKGEPGLLRTTTQFDDFTLRLEFKATAETNSGIFLRTSPRPRNPAKDCYEINIAPRSNPYPTGSIVGRIVGDIPKDFDFEAWHSLEIQCIGSILKVRVDNKPVCEYRDREPLGKGYIGLQLNQGPVSFRNIRLRPEGLVPMFNGKNLAGWKEYPEMKSRFEVKDGILRVQDGPGQLETRRRYRNFVMQLEVRTLAPELNSGVFFRCIPGERMNGYESQIHNGCVDGDRSRPRDHGTGGIFRRKPARRVVADDGQWFIKTIIADGPHFATWVNGEMVCDWTDQRKPDANPRKGLRLDAGTIMIQGHDPTTDIEFRNLKIHEIRDRWANRF